ncbi:MAG: hypothetical protein JWN52_1689 [Actinomycetia bacterium]|nr:hypothetical protein [Actinomycetes bacterium]
MDNLGPARVLARLTVASALLLVAWLVVSLPLLMAGMFRIGPALVLFVLAAALILALGFRGVTRSDVRGGPTSWWVVGGVVAVALAFLALQLIMCSEQIIVRRDPASYVQFAVWLQEHGSLPISEYRWAFGGDDPALSFGSPGFYPDGHSLVPQFMAGLPMVLTLGGWIGGTSAMVAMAPLLGACAVLSFGGLTARLIGPRWAPLGALALALTLPMQWVSRSTYSELPALVLLLGGLALMHDVRELSAGTEGTPVWKQPVRVRAALAGLALGLTVLVRIDGLRDVLPVVVFAGLLVARRRRTGLPLFAGLAVGVGAGLVEGFTLSRQYLSYLHQSLDPLLLMAVTVVAATVLMVTLLLWPVTGVRLRRVGAWISASRWPDVGAAVTVIVMILFAVRPYLQTEVRIPHSADDKLTALAIQTIQTYTGLPVQPDRLYGELSLYWVVWYIGVPALLLGTFGAALLVRRLLRRRSLEWVLPYSVIVWTTVTTLLRPGITPDHPWASRRLISVVIPGMLLFAIWALAWVVRRIRRLGYGRQATGAAAMAGALLLLVPIAATSVGLMFSKTEQGEIVAVRQLCQKLGQGASVLIVERVTAERFAQVIRGMCGLPTARVRILPGAKAPDPAEVQRVIKKIYGVQRRPVLLGAEASQVAPYGLAQPALHVVSRSDGHSLITPPHGTWRLDISIWMAEPLGPG